MMFGTVLAGVLVFVLGQIVVRFVIDPIVAFKMELGLIQHLLLKNRQTILNLYKHTELAEEVGFRGAKLIASRRAVPLYDWFGKLKVLPEATVVTEGFEKLRDLRGSLLIGNHGVGAGIVYLQELGELFDIPEISFDI